MDAVEQNESAGSQKSDAELEAILEPETTDSPDGELSPEKHPEYGYLEGWALLFASLRERQQGCRELRFSEQLSDVRDQVSMCLEVLPVLVELMADSAWSSRLIGGFEIITALITEAAVKTLRCYDQENAVLRDILDR